MFRSVGPWCRCSHWKQAACRFRRSLRILSYFIPGTLKAVLEVDAVGEHGEGSGLEDEGLAARLDVTGPAEGAPFKSFGDTPITRSVEVQDLDEVASFVGEEEGGSAGGINVHLGTGNLGESVEGLAHVGGCQGDVDLEVSVKG